MRSRLFVVFAEKVAQAVLLPASLSKRIIIVTSLHHQQQYYIPENQIKLANKRRKDISLQKDEDRHVHRKVTKSKYEKRYYAYSKSYTSVQLQRFDKFLFFFVRIGVIML